MIALLIFRFLFLVLLSCQVFAYEVWKEGNNGNIPKLTCEYKEAMQDAVSSRAPISVGVHLHNNLNKHVAQAYIFRQYIPEKVKSHLHNVILPNILNVTIANYALAIPGCFHPQGFRGLVRFDHSQFSRQEQSTIAYFEKRVESYVARIEKILFDKNGRFRGEQSHDDQVALALICANFLVEFYPRKAQVFFEELACTNPVCKTAYGEVGDWHVTKYVKGHSKQKLIDAISNHPSNILFAQVQDAVRKSNFDLALQLGNKRVLIEHKLLWRDKYDTVFGAYPQLRTQVEEAARKHAEQISRGLSQQQIVADNLCDAYVDRGAQHLSRLRQNEVEKLIDGCGAVVNDRESSKIVYPISESLSDAIYSRLLTADKLGIELYGDQLQHALMETTITTADSFIDLKQSSDYSNHLDELDESFFDFTNAAVAANKTGDVVLTSRLVDACWAMLDCATVFTKHMRNGADVIYSNFTAPAMHGVGKKLVNAAHTVTHPVKAVTECLDAFGICMHYVGKVAANTAIDYAKIDVLLNETSYLDSHRAEQLGVALDNYEPAIVTLGEGLHDFPWKETIKNISVPDVVEGIAGTITEVLLFHGVTKFSHSP